MKSYVRPLTPVSPPASPENGGTTPVIGRASTLPTAPSPSAKYTDPFESIDDVPSIHSVDEGHVSDEVDQVEIPRLPSQLPLTLSPPLTPSSNGEHDGKTDKHALKLLTKLGGYGWRV